MSSTVASHKTSTMYGTARPLPDVIVAPMAGGPSRPELVTAALRLGSVQPRQGTTPITVAAFLAAGYLSADQLERQIRTVQDSLADAPDMTDTADVPHSERSQAYQTASPQGLFGVNIFCPPEPLRDEAAVENYRRQLQELAGELGVEDLPHPHCDDDAFAAKIEVLLRNTPPLVSFTFGLPPVEVIQELQAQDAFILQTVTSVDEALRAVEAGVDALIVQGCEAGGHQGSFTVGSAPRSMPTLDLVREVKHAVLAQGNSLPLVAAGGINGRAKRLEALAAGANAVACGTAFLLAEEAGTGALLRQAIAEKVFEKTAVTCSFTGRWARGFANKMALYEHAPREYPYVHQVTSPLRKAAYAAGDYRYAHLWAGTEWQSAREASLEEILRDF